MAEIGFRRRTLPRRKSILTYVIEIFSIVSAASFILSAIINMIVFRLWGINFLAIASPSDVVMSGISLAVQSSLPLAFGWLVWRSQGSEVKMTRYIGVAVTILIVILYFIRMSFHSVTWREYHWSLKFLSREYAISIDELLFPHQAWATVVLAGLIGLMIANFHRIDAKLQTVTLSAILLFGFYLADSWLTIVKWGGFMPRVIAYQPERYGPNIILWTGDRAVVARRAPGHVFVVFWPESAAAELPSNRFEITFGEQTLAEGRLQHLAAKIDKSRRDRFLVEQACAQKTKSLNVNCVDIMREYDRHFQATEDSKALDKP